MPNELVIILSPQQLLTPQLRQPLVIPFFNIIYISFSVRKWSSSWVGLPEKLLTESVEGCPWFLLTKIPERIRYERRPGQNKQPWVVPNWIDFSRAVSCLTKPHFNERSTLRDQGTGGSSCIREQCVRSSRATLSLRYCLVGIKCWQKIYSR